MAIFKLTKDTVVTANGIVISTRGIADHGYNLLALISNTLDDAPAILLALRNFLQNLENLAENAINALRNNPLIKGPWRILIQIIIGLLRGVKVVLSGLVSAANTTINAFRNRRIRELRDQVTNARLSISDLTAALNEVEVVLGYLLVLCDFLENQQPRIEKAFPSLKISVESNQLRQAYLQLQAIHIQLQVINSELDKINRKADAVRVFMNQVNNIVAMGSSVVNAINSILGVFNDVLRRIRDWISNIPGIGWLMSKLDYFIEKAFDVLGINQLLNRMGNAVRGLPIVQKVLDYLRDLEAMAEDLANTVRDSITKFVEAMNQHNRVKQIKSEVIQIFSQLDYEKLVAEFWIPEWVQELIELKDQVKALLDRITESQEPELEVEVKGSYKELAEGAVKLASFANTNHSLPFNQHLTITLQQNLQELVESAGINLVNADTFLEYNDNVEFEISEIRDRTRRMGDALTAIQATLKQVMPEENTLSKSVFINEYRRLIGSKEYDPAPGQWRFDQLPTELLKKHVD